MIDEKKLIEDLQKWSQDDLFTPKQFEMLIKAQKRLSIRELIKRVIKGI